MKSDVCPLNSNITAKKLELYAKRFSNLCKIDVRVDFLTTINESSISGSINGTPICDFKKVCQHIDFACVVLNLVGPGDIFESS